MPPSRKLADLEQTLDSLYETLGEAQKRLAYANDIFEKNSIKQRIRKEVLPELHQVEAEYWQLLAQEARNCDVPEDDASLAIVEIVPEVQIIQSQPSANYADEFMQLLKEIRDKLNEPGTPAAAKAKFTLSLIPGILSYEVELDTENSLRRVFQPIRQLFRREIEKK
ncbi:hypothetical protein H6S82_13175 [Planktothrix sp. FACHB-1355]|uniref:Uncharacterized protein n=1 Tax=Aerosakkonema funiforme FACHB-1375 TaxID=2949571 RepID=A0A926ZIS1_9CYAN|nr:MULTISPECIES: hypothetical protein [Oscillatoriales]MBD2182091.1 hypothetical protein [Aerosakkonema funiforme FACHB-1375]MBD3559806.1 hypothetical protein [Planktothrix sp. FACHB-1355]